MRLGIYTQTIHSMFKCFFDLNFFTQKIKVLLQQHTVRFLEHLCFLFYMFIYNDTKYHLQNKDNTCIQRTTLVLKFEGDSFGLFIYKYTVMEHINLLHNSYLFFLCYIFSARGSSFPLWSLRR